MTESIDLANWERRFQAFLTEQADEDTSHGLDHVERVVAAAKRIGREEAARMAVVVPAAWLHDCVNVEKNAPHRHQASTLAADRAVAFLREAGYPAAHLDAIHHAIRAHSFSAKIPPETLEAKIVQDADRLDALGAIGLARCFMVGGRLGLRIYDVDDPFCRDRPPDDRRFIVDHFYAKLMTLPETMQTPAGRREAQRRVKVLSAFLEALAGELPEERG